MQKLSKVISLLLVLFIVSCSPNIYEKAFPTLIDGKYDSEFPYNSSSKQLEEIGETVRMINTLCFYSSYVFPDEVNISEKDLTEENIRQYGEAVKFFNHTASGTATVIFSTINSVVLLTCAHIVNFPDKIVSYYPSDLGGYSDRVQSVAVREKQTIWVVGLPERGEVELLTADNDLDIALLGKQYKPGIELIVNSFDYPIGQAKQLEWGSFVYIFGYPLNYKMITKGIVSSPDRDNKGSFLIDAVFNKGYSGGIVLAIRDGVPNFEMVGMIKSVPRKVNIILNLPQLKKNKKLIRVHLIQGKFMLMSVKI